MAKLKLALLGTPLVEHGDSLVVFPTRKATALLIYLVLQGGIQTRDKIAALFWQDSSAEQGRASLRGTLAYIREALGETGAQIHGERHLLTDREALHFNPDADFELDLARLEVGAQSARQSHSSDSPAALTRRFTQLQEAAQNVRGEFLEGFSLSDAPEFDDWVSLQREIWHQKASSVMDALSRLQFEGGELPGALETTTRWVALDSFNEAAHRRLMQLYLALGERAAAIRTYEEYAALLARELNAEPAPETEALAQRARIQAFALPEQDSPQAETRFGAEVSLVGRRTEHLQLVAAYRTARRGRLQIALVEGEPGIGKTRLAKEFLAWAAAQGADILRGRAFETGAQLPYQAPTAALRERLARQENLDGLLARTWWAELQYLLPDLTDRLPNLPKLVAMNEGEARTRLFEAFTKLLLAFAERAPTVLFIDDLPWADAASLDLLGYAVRRWLDAGAPILFLATARSEDLTQPSGAGVILEHWLATLAREVEVQHVSLGPLDLSGTSELIRAYGIQGKAEDTQEFNERLFAETRGQPFFVLETLKSLTERGMLERDEGGKFGLVGFETQDADRRDGLFLPTSLRDLIRTRVARLTRDAQLICYAGAVLGDGFDLHQVGDVAEMETRQALPLLEEALQRGLLRENADRYLFTHDKIREVVYAETSQARRRELHRRALAVLEKQNAPAAERARHALAAGENERAAVLYVAAGDEAMRVFAVRNAMVHYEHALALGATDLALSEKLGRTYEFLNEWARARERYQKLLEQARAERDAAMQTIALNRLATVSAQGFFDLPAALGFLEQALDAAEQSGQDTRRAETEWSLSQIFFYVWELDRSRSHAERALTLARALGDTELAARSLNVLAYIQAVSYGTLADVEQQAQEARSLFARLGNRAMEVECLTIIAIARVFSGFPNETISIAQEGLHIAREIENPWGQANCSYTMVFALIELGKSQEALELAQTGVAAARAAKHPPILVFNLSALGRAYRELGDFSAALAADLEAQAISEKLHHPFVSELAAIDLCADYAQMRDWDTAYQYARAAQGIRKYERLYPGFTRALETEAYVRAGEMDAAQHDIERFGAHSRDNQRMQLQYHDALALLAQARGDISTARREWDAAQEIARVLQLESKDAQMRVQPTKMTGSAS